MQTVIYLSPVCSHYPGHGISALEGEQIEQEFKVSEISQVTLWRRAQRTCSLSKLSSWFQSQCILLQQTAITFALQGGNPAGNLTIPLRMPFRIWKGENPGSSPVNVTITSHPIRFPSALAKTEDQCVYSDLWQFY